MDRTDEQPEPEGDGAPGAAPARLAGLYLRPGSVLAVLRAASRTVPVQLEFPVEQTPAVRCLWWLHGHRHGCRVGVDVHVGLLERCVRVLGGGRPALVIDAGDPPAFRLHVRRDGTTTDVPLGPLDALCLLLSPRVPVHLRPPDVSTDWDGALQRLLDDPHA